MKKILLVILLLYASSAYADLKVAVGSYTADATDDRQIDISDTTSSPSIADFTPKAVFVKCDTTASAIWYSDAMAADLSLRPTVSTNGAANLIQSLNSNGFVIGSDAAVNPASGTCWYLALGGSDVATGTYAGNNADPRTIAISPTITPIMVLAQKLGASASQMWGNTTCTDVTWYTPSGTAALGDIIQACGSGSFEVGNGIPGVNETSSTNYYVTIASVSGQSAVGSFTGDTNDNRDITALSFQPDFVWIKGASSTATACVRFKDQTSDDSISLGGAASTTNQIQSMLSNGFQVGTASCANENTINMNYFALKSETQTTFVLTQPIFFQ